MVVCKNCGAEYEEDEAEVCDVCGSYLNEEAPREKTRITDLSRGRSENALNGLALAEGEVVVRSYRCASIKVPAAEGYLTVTNKRVIFQGVGTGSRVVQETALDGISGVNGFYGYNINIKGMIIGGLIAFFGLLNMADRYTRNFSMIAMIALVIGIVIMVLSFKKAFILQFTSSKASGTGISLGGGTQNLLGNGALYTLAAEPTNVTDRMMDEVGAMILDLQTLGDMAIRNWQ